MQLNEITYIRIDMLALLQKTGFSYIKYAFLILLVAPLSTICMEEPAASPRLLTQPALQAPIPSLKLLALNRYIEIILHNPRTFSISIHAQIPTELDAHIAKKIVDYALIETMKTSKKHKNNHTKFSSTSHTARLCPTATMQQCCAIFHESNNSFSCVQPYMAYTTVLSERNYTTNGTILAFDSSPNNAWAVDICQTIDTTKSLSLVSNPFILPAKYLEQPVHHNTIYKSIFIDTTTFVLKTDEGLFSYHIANPQTTAYTNTIHAYPIDIGDIKNPWAREYLKHDDDNIQNRCAYIAYADAGQKGFFNTECLHIHDIEHALSEYRKEYGIPATPSLWQCVCDHEENTHFYIQADRNGSPYTISSVIFDPNLKFKLLLQLMNNMYTTRTTNNTPHSLSANAACIYHATTHTGELTKDVLKEKMGHLYEQVSPPIMQLAKADR